METVLHYPPVDEHRSHVCSQRTRSVETAHQPSVSTQSAIRDEVAERRNVRFEKYVTPYLRMIYRLCIRYTNQSEDIPDNYTEVLANMYRYTETYDSQRPIHTWLHIVTKRCVYDLDRRRQKQQSLWNRDNEVDSFTDDWDTDDGEHSSFRVMDLSNYQDYYNDDILFALEQLKPSYKRAFLLQQAGYKLKEIAEIEYKNGALESRNIETVKSRLFLARQQLQQLLTRDGKRRTAQKTD